VIRAHSSFAPGKRRGKRNRCSPRSGGSAHDLSQMHGGSCGLIARSVDRPRCGAFWSISMPEAAGKPLGFACCCFPLLPRLRRQKRGSKKRPREAVLK
jgi:hypothetical protein